MGKKGGGGSRGFMKAARRAPAQPEEGSQPAEPVDEPKVPKEGAEEEEDSDDDGENPFLKAQAPSQPSAAKPAAPKAAAASSSNAQDSGSDEDRGESRGHMLQRHKKELRALRDSFKKMGKLDKGEKKRRETVQEEEMLARQLQELMVRDGKGQAAEPEEGGDEDGQDEGQESKGKQTKAQKRREKQMQKDAEREAAIREEVDNMGETDRMAEEKQLTATLEPLGLCIHDIVPDGNCMYRSLAHQCELKDLNALIDNKSSLEAHIVLRQKAADHIAAHPDDFMPFILDDSGVAPAEQLEKYCRNLKDTATWGSQVELQALAAALRIQIQVFNAAMPVVVMGEEFKTSDKPALQVCYQAYAYGSGEHYNSIVPLTA